ncbi:hypothetical protein FKW77_008114 [Venturia effusa]|uniref:Uncharacterized protein n=1 Tax=Venturia effusa TaxID=50376 RepID=A0A517KZT6_9PEZI|nr:hypothetical protein FKW77_008114 [Venturia effusa]
MNTARSVGSYGWFVLCAAGGGAYYFAKKSINADREARHTTEVQRRAKLQAQYEEDARLQYGSRNSGATGMGNGDTAASPSREASSSEPAPTRHAPENDAQRVGEKSKYEASEVWRSKKGDRFS